MDPEELRANVKKAAIIGSFFALALVFYALQWRGALVAYVIVVGLLATLAILIQSGKGGGLAASLGGVGADSLLGTHSATPIAKATYVMLGLCIAILVLLARLGPSEGNADELGPVDAAPPMELPIPGVLPPAGDAPANASAPADVPAPAGAPADAAPPVEPAAND